MLEPPRSDLRLQPVALNRLKQIANDVRLSQSPSTPTPLCDNQTADWHYWRANTNITGLRERPRQRGILRSRKDGPVERHNHRELSPDPPDLLRRRLLTESRPLSQNNILKAVISESTPEKASAPAFKFAVNSTIVQHLVPTSQLNKSQGTSTSTGTSTEESKDGSSSDSAATAMATATDGKPHVGRRGMHSATGAYWNEDTDGMWSYKYDGGEAKGMDVVIMLIWIAL